MDRSVLFTGTAGIIGSLALGPQIVDVLEFIIQLKYGVPLPAKVTTALVTLINVGIMLLVLWKTKGKPVKLDEGITVDAKPREPALTEEQRAELRTKLTEGGK